MSSSRKYTEQELDVLRSLFDSCDPDRTTTIHINQLPGLLAKLGKSGDETVAIMNDASQIADSNEGLLTFDDFAIVVEKHDIAQETPMEGPDPKVLEFLRILEEYRIKCEDEGNYLEAGRAHKQLSILRKQEEKRQQKAIKARQIAERQEVQMAHNMQFQDFNVAWDKYMDEFDNMAQMYIQQMTEKHAMVLLEFQKQLRSELSEKPPKWSKELLEQRRKQHINARNKNYAEAQRLKKVCDRTEEKERDNLEEGVALAFARREAKYRIHQQAELQALLKRIECRRKEHIKQRNLDCKRLLQRNKNVQTVLDSKQNMESQKLFDEVKKGLNQSFTFSNIQPSGNSNSAKNTANKTKRSSASAKGYEDRDYRNNNNSNEEYKNSGGGGYDETDGNYDGGGGGEGYDNSHSPAFLRNEGPNFGLSNSNEKTDD